MPKSQKIESPIVVEEVKAKISSKEAIAIANRFILENMRDRFSAGLPKRMTFPIKSLWIVPILLTYPKTGIIGEVGMVAIDEEQGAIVGWTPKNEAEKLARKLYEERKSDIEIAFS